MSTQKAPSSNSKLLPTPVPGSTPTPSTLPSGAGPSTGSLDPVTPSGRDVQDQESLASISAIGPLHSVLAHTAAPTPDTSVDVTKDLLSALEELLSSVKRGGPASQDLKNRADAAIDKAHEAPKTLEGQAGDPLQGEALVAKLNACSPVALSLLLALEPLLFAVRHGDGASGWDRRIERAETAIAKAREASKHTPQP